MSAAVSGLVQAVSGLVQVVTAGTAVAALIFTAASLDATRDQIKISEQGQIADRYSRAIEQLGQQGPDKLQVRLGGIYALEHLARDSPRDQATIIEVLTTFVRVSTHSKPLNAGGSNCPENPPAPDAQAALTVLGRRVVVNDGAANINLNNLCLNSADLASANLNKATLNGTSLRRANFVGAHLEDVQFFQADLSGAQLWNADLSGARLESANLTDADLMDSKLVGADLSWVTVNGNTNFIGVDFYGANLEHAPIR